MTAAPERINDGETLTVRILLRLRKRGGRKLLIAPEGATAWAPQRARVDNALVKAIARAHRWRRLIESGEYASVTELAAAEKINQSYVCRVLRLTLLAPEIVEAMLDGHQQGGLSLATLLEPFPVDWREQRDAFGLKAVGSIHSPADPIPRQSLPTAAFVLCPHRVHKSGLPANAARIEATSSAECKSAHPNCSFCVAAASIRLCEAPADIRKSNQPRMRLRDLGGQSPRALRARRRRPRAKEMPLAAPSRLKSDVARAPSTRAGTQ